MERAGFAGSVTPFDRYGGMLLHPPDSLRRYFVAGSGLAAVMAAGVGVACVLALWRGEQAGLEAAALGCFSVAAATLAALLVQFAWVFHGGPSVQRSAVGGDVLLTASFLLTGTALGGGALGMVARQLAGEGRAPDALVFTLSALLGVLGATLLLGFVVKLGNLVLRGPTTFVLEDPDVERGGVLRGRLEVPFAAKRALELEVLIELVRSQPGPSPDDPRNQAVVFSASVRAVASLPLGPRRAGARIEIPLEFAPPATRGDPLVLHFWHLEVEPANGDVWWNAVLEPEIDWKP